MEEDIQESQLDLIKHSASYVSHFSAWSHIYIYISKSSNSTESDMENVYLFTRAGFSNIFFYPKARKLRPKLNCDKTL